MSVTVFEHAAVFDGSTLLVDQSVVVYGGTIAAIGRAIQAPTDAERIDSAGRTLLPGLIDGHTHTMSPDLRQALVFGVTTELDMFTDPRLAAALKERNMRSEAADIPDLRSAGLAVTAPGGHLTQFAPPFPTLEGPDQAQAFVDARVAEGSDYIKIAYEDGASLGRTHPTTGRPFGMLSKATLSAVVDAAHQRHKRAIVHVTAQRHAREAVEAGADGLAHLFVDEPPDISFAELLAGRGVFVITTLSVLRAATGAPAGERLLGDQRIAPHLDESSRQTLEAAPPPHTTSASFRFAEDELRQLLAAGVTVVAGTDAGLPGTAHGASLHGELELLVEAGMTPEQALAAATSAAANAFDLVDRGRIRPGLRADLLLVDGDPTREIRLTRAIVGVWKRGVPVTRGSVPVRQAEAMR